MCEEDWEKKYSEIPVISMYFDDANRNTLLTAGSF